MKKKILNALKNNDIKSFRIIFMFIQNTKIINKRKFLPFLPIHPNDLTKKKAGSISGLFSD